jgi:hypothetical protein
MISESYQMASRMLLSRAEEHDMSTPGRILASLVLAALFLAIAVLEVVSERVRVEPAITEPSPVYLADLEAWEESGYTLTVPEETRSIVALRNGQPAGAGPER